MPDFFPTREQSIEKMKAFVVRFDKWLADRNSVVSDPQEIFISCAKSTKQFDADLMKNYLHRD